MMIITLAAVDLDFVSLGIGAAAGLVVGIVVALLIVRSMSSGAIKRASDEAKRIVTRAEEDARSLVQRAELDADKRNAEQAAAGVLLAQMESE